MTPEIYHSFKEISREDWQALVPESFPFASYDFLSALETTGCLGRRTGWVPVIAVLRPAIVGHGITAALVAFIKNNSYGEYIFDFAWAQAHEASGAQYYPKIVSAIPFTPATGPKLLFAAELPTAARQNAADALLTALADFAKKTGSSSEHFLFIPEDQIPYFKPPAYFLRHSFQFHWRNAGYKNFEDFLASLKGKRRREIVRERSQVAKVGLKIERLTGAKLTAEHGQIMYQFYLSTLDKMSGMNYLTPEFFTTVFTTMKDNILFVLATNDDGMPVAGALNFYGNSTLFGRQWGCLEEYKSLHFELCYYQGIEFAIEKKFTLFEAGAQGEHKFQRGFLPSLTYSAHQVHHTQMDVAIRNHVDYEKSQIKAMIVDYMEHSPFATKGNS